MTKLDLEQLVQKLHRINVNVKVNNEIFTLLFSCYHNGRISIDAYTQSGEPEIRLTTNLVEFEIRQDQTFLMIYDTSHEWQRVMFDIGLVKYNPSPEIVSQGFVENYAQLVDFQKCYNKKHCGHNDLKLFCKDCISELSINLGN